MKKHKGGFSIFIEMPDGSRNYIHNKPEWMMRDAIEAKRILEDQVIDDENTVIIKDGSYLRIECKLQANGKKQRFHSRLLNDLDAQKEYEMLVY